MGAPAQLDGFTLLDRPPGADWPWPVYRRGDGPPVLVLHELFGVTRVLLEFARLVADAGFSVWLPALAGPVPASSGLDKARTVLNICLSREVNVLVGGRTSRIVEPLRALGRHAATSSGASGVGVIGMCFSGGFALALAADEHVLAAVSAEPALPVATPVTPWCARDLGMSTADIAEVRRRLGAGDVEVLVTRFSADRKSPATRLDTIRQKFGPEGLTVDELPSGPGNEFRFDPGEHSVLTGGPMHYRCESPAGERLLETEERVFAFLRRRLAA
ncbi:dienelactone hydrolase family protein [Pengzhenrongella sp.]|jgi:dienelactone hydrolase|uniref:dienelactone hydrolase family protein n=1 Tax=Pengzhenrongella sp. TaxID=2888820 RepID=UPI002F933DC0